MGSDDGTRPSGGTIRVSWRVWLVAKEIHFSSQLMVSGGKISLGVMSRRNIPEMG